MTRLWLSVGVGVATLLLGLVTAIVQSHNRAEGHRLDQLREECMLIEATNGVRAEQILELDHGPVSKEELRARAELSKKSAR